MFGIKREWYINISWFLFSENILKQEIELIDYNEHVFNNKDVNWLFISDN